MPWLPGFARRALAAAYHRARRAMSRQRSARQRRAMLPGLEGASLVVAESIGAATAAVAHGLPARRVWALALPADRLNAGDRTGFAAEVAGAAATIGGFLTDSEPARDSLERAASASRPRVEVFPPLATDRACQDHARPRVPGQPGSPEAADPGHPAAAQLAQWRRMLDQQRGGGPDDPPYSFAAARLRGALARWAPSPPSTWGAGAPAAAPALPVDWSAAAQERAARRVWEAVWPRPPRQPRRPRSVLVGGFDLKFAEDLAERLGDRTDLAVAVDDWPTLGRGTRRGAAQLRTADSIFAEWARTNAVYYSRHKRPDQLLVVRLHRYELDARYPGEIAIENVDAVVYIAPLFGRRIRDELAWPAEKLVYIPNLVDLDWLDRPKLPGARFTIGFVGIEWSRKRFDLALDLLARLRREDRRFTLAVRSTMPWHNPYARTDAGERAYLTRCLERIDHDPWLRDAVVFDEPGRDMARWFRRIGHVLSTSDEEGSHTAVTEGMASGAVPVIRPWLGADEIYDSEWVYSTVDEAAGAVLACADAEVWAERGARAKAEVRRTHDPVSVVDAWADLLHGDLASARGYFATQPDSAAATAPGPRRPVPAEG
jgi:glycosyltransferase involved in cell wall biosynthesis